MATKLFLAALLLVTSVVAHAAEPPDLLTEAEAKARAQRVSNVTYGVHLTFRAKSEKYGGTATLNFDLAGAPADLRVDFRSAGVKSVTINGAKQEKTGADGVKIVLPARALKAGGNAVTVEYENGYDRSASGVHHFLDPVDQREYLYTDFEPYYAHRLIPCFDQPDIKAKYTLSVTAPKGWEVIGNSPETRSAPDGDAIRHELEETPPLPTYIFFVAAGPYAKFVDAKSKLPSRLYMRQSMKQYTNAEDIFDTTRRGMAFFQEYFSTPYPFKKYDQLFVPEFNSGAMENAGAVTFNERYLHRHTPNRLELHGRAGTILHEMAHMWFGDLVTMRWWDGLWLNESFATILASVALEKATRYTEAFEVFLLQGKARAYWQDQLPTTHPVDGPVVDTDTAFSNFDGITYGKGASMLKQLSFLVGEKAFKDGLARYFKKHAWKNTEINDFLAAISEASGRDLTGWADLQLRSSGVNTVSVKVEERAGRVTAVWLEQGPGNADAKLRPHRLQVAAYHADKNGRPRRHRIATVELAGARTRVRELEGAPAYAFVWPNHGDFAYVKVALDPRSRDFALKHLDKLPDGLTRRGVWLTLWEMVRDAQLAPKSFIETFLAKAPLEPDAMTIEQLMSRVETALERYMKEGPDPMQERVFQLAWAQLVRAPAGSDLQRTWFDVAATSPTKADSLAKLEELLDGKASFRGLVLDQDKRWKLVATLSARGRPGTTARIAAELKRDPTDMGQRNAVIAEAAAPDPEVKKKVFKRIEEDRTVSLDLLKAAMSSFHQPHAPELSKAYVHRFFEAIPKLRTNGEQELNEAFVERMYPHFVFDPEVIQRTENFLAANAGMGDDLKKPLKNGADELRRALAVRAK
jgi:aminopeptidase N